MSECVFSLVYGTCTEIIIQVDVVKVDWIITMALLFHEQVNNLMTAESEHGSVHNGS